MNQIIQLRNKASIVFNTHNLVGLVISIKYILFCNEMTLRALSFTSSQSNAQINSVPCT